MNKLQQMFSIRLNRLPRTEVEQTGTTYLTADLWLLCLITVVPDWLLVAKEQGSWQLNRLKCEIMLIISWVTQN